MFGRRSVDEVRLRYRDIAKPNVDVRQETVISIDPDRKSVVTDRGVHEADILVIALGADLDVDATPGLLECGHEFYSFEGAAQLRGTLAGFDRGRHRYRRPGGFLQMPTSTL